jgi:putative ABC transport system ATP-binding protein
MLHVEHLTKTFKSGETIVTAVNDVSLQLQPGAFVAIVGKSGSGKSTLLSLLGALDVPTSGEVEVNKVKITSLSDMKLIAYRRREVGFVFQNYQLVPNLTALENVMLPMEFAGLPSSKRRARAVDLLTMVGLDEVKQQRKPGRLSGGEQQRVAIARAMANKPHLILADEPTGNLDSQTGETIIQLLKELAQKEQTIVVVVTHDASLAQKADETYQLHDGHLTKASKRGVSVLAETSL